MTCKCIAIFSFCKPTFFGLPASGAHCISQTSSQPARSYTSVSQASIEHTTRFFVACCMALHFDPEHGGSTSLRNVYEVSLPHSHCANPMHTFRTYILSVSSDLLGFWTVCIVRYSRNLRTQRFGNWICFRPQVKMKTPTPLCPVERVNLHHWPTHVSITTAI
jgi:hypothetical protein